MENQLAKSEVALDCVPDFVLCRPAKSNWIGVGMLLFLVAMLLSLLLIPRDPGVPVMTSSERLMATLFVGVLASPFILGAGWLVRWIQRGSIIADSEKILWREAGKARMARWEDVLDYYLVSTGSTPIHAIETSSGTLKFGAASWTNAPELAAFIQAHARNAKATSWQRKGVRAVDPWPRTFHYRTFENRWFTPFMAFASLASPLVLASVADFSKIQKTYGEIYALYGWPLVAFSIVFSIGGIALMPYLSYCGLLQSWRETQRRGTERIEATPDGIFWTDGTRRVDAVWDEVRAFYSRPSSSNSFAGSTYIVETARGDFNFTRELGGFAKLQQTIAMHATRAQPGVWHPEGLATEQPIQADGAQIYHYRTSGTRLVLWAATIFALLPVTMPLLMNYVEQPMDDFQPHTLWWGPTILLLIGVAGARRYYYTSNIRVDEHGVTKITARGEQFLAWECVEKYFQNPSTSNLIVEGRDAAGQKVRLSFSASIAGYRDLRDEIEKRATHSLNRTWPDKSPHALPSRAVAPPPSEGERGTLNDW